MTDVSSGQTVVVLRGSAVRDVLAKGCPLDLASEGVPPSGSARRAISRRRRSCADPARWPDEDGAFEIVVRRSFADYVWAWLEDAAAEYGFTVDDMNGTTAGIALFDLDYTLLGGDATYEWIQFLIRLGVLDADARRRRARPLLRRVREGHARHRRVPALRLPAAVAASARAARGVARAVSRRVTSRRSSCREARELIASHDGARPRDGDRHRGQQLHHHADRRDARRGDICSRAIPRRATASSPAASTACPASTRARSSGSTRGSTSAAAAGRLRRELVLRRFAERRAADGEGHESGRGRPGRRAGTDRARARLADHLAAMSAA